MGAGAINQAPVLRSSKGDEDDEGDSAIGADEEDLIIAPDGSGNDTLVGVGLPGPTG